MPSRAQQLIEGVVNIHIHGDGQVSGGPEPVAEAPTDASGPRSKAYRFIVKRDEQGRVSEVEAVKD